MEAIELRGTDTIAGVLVMVVVAVLAYYALSKVFNARASLAREAVRQFKALHVYSPEPHLCFSGHYRVPAIRI